MAALVWYYPQACTPGKFSLSKEIAMRFPPWLSLEGMAIQKKDILYTSDIIKQKLAIPILLSIEEGFTHSVTSQSDTWKPLADWYRLTSAHACFICFIPALVHV